MVGRFSPAASSSRWDTRLEMILAGRDAVRVLDTGSILRLAHSARQGVSEATVDRWITDAIQDGRLVRVVRGLYLNRMVTPLVALCEAASRLRADAVVSLQQVLGEVGALQIDSAVVTAIVPFSPDRPVPSLGTLHTQGGDFHFRGMPASILDAGRESDRLVEARLLEGDTRSGAAALVVSVEITAKHTHRTSDGDRDRRVERGATQ